MLTVLSPAKKLLHYKSAYTDVSSLPRFIDKTSALAKIMKSRTVADIAALMDLSKDLATLNFARFQDFYLEHCPPDKSYPALFIFQGDVYQGLQAKTWDSDAVEYAQAHLGILSGLYGFLKPLDLIQPYRLEMGVRLANPAGNTLYDYWKQAVTQELQEQLKKHTNPILLNLASNEYFKVIDRNNFGFPIVTINFYENADFKMIGIHAKKARGTMAKFIMQNRIDDLEGLKAFKELGYHFNQGSSNDEHLDFIRS